MKTNTTKISNTVRELVTSAGNIVLVSYTTPVAVLLSDGSLIETSTVYSPTTTRHLAKFRKRHGYPVTKLLVPQHEINRYAPNESPIDPHLI